MRVLRILAYALGIVVSVLYLLNLGAGVIELIPDTLPIVGNLDEAAFTTLLLWCLRGLVREWRARLPAPE